MPQVDLETLVSACAGGSCDSKVACETIVGGENPEAAREFSDPPEIPTDFPPESFWLSKDAEFDWFDRNAFYERKESTKGNSANSTNLNPSSNSNSQRFSSNLKSKASIIGLPKPQKSCFVDAKNRKNAKPGNTRLFPKRSGSVHKSDQPVIEPSSPKVSCMGRVRSKRDRNRRLRNRQRSCEPVSAKGQPAGRKRNALFASFRAIFRTGGKSRHGLDRSAPLPEPPRSARSVSRDIRDRLPPGEAYSPSQNESLPRRSSAAVSESDGPGLGGMKRFASGRRSDSWANDLA